MVDLWRTQAAVSIVREEPAEIAVAPYPARLSAVFGWIAMSADTPHLLRALKINFK
jgi:hypothetical protein